LNTLGDNREDIVAINNPAFIIGTERILMTI
jgi:hypothetical protein